MYELSDNKTLTGDEIYIEYVAINGQKFYNVKKSMASDKAKISLDVCHLHLVILSNL